MSEIDKIHIPILAAAKEEIKVFQRFEQLNDLLGGRGITFMPGYSRYQNYSSYVSLILVIQIDWMTLNRSAGRKNKELNLTLQDVREMKENGQNISDIASSFSISKSALYRRLKRAKEREAAGEPASRITI